MSGGADHKLSTLLGVLGLVFGRTAPSIAERRAAFGPEGYVYIEQRASNDCVTIFKQTKKGTPPTTVCIA